MSMVEITEYFLYPLQHRMHKSPEPPVKLKLLNRTHYGKLIHDRQVFNTKCYRVRIFSVTHVLKVGG